MAGQVIRTVLLFAVIIGFCLALGAYLSYANVRGHYQEILDTRLRMVAERIGVVAETAQSIGIPLAEQQTLPGLLMRERIATPLLLSIDVASAEGRVLFSTDPARLDSRLESGTADDALAFHRSRMISNDFGLTTGEIRLRYDRLKVERRLDGLARDIVLDVTPAIAAGLVVGCGGILLLMLRRREDDGEDDA